MCSKKERLRLNRRWHKGGKRKRFHKCDRKALDLAIKKEVKYREMIDKWKRQFSLSALKVDWPIKRISRAIKKALWVGHYKVPA